MPMVQLLLEKGADVNATIANGEFTALQEAAFRGRGRVLSQE